MFLFKLKFEIIFSWYSVLIGSVEKQIYILMYVLFCKFINFLSLYPRINKDDDYWFYLSFILVFKWFLKLAPCKRFYSVLLSSSFLHSFRNNNPKDYSPDSRRVTYLA